MSEKFEVHNDQGEILGTFSTRAGCIAFIFGLKDPKMMEILIFPPTEVAASDHKMTDSPTHLGPSGTGRLELIMGCMFSGKSTELIRRARRYQVAGRQVLLIKHTSDTRYSGASTVETHDHEKMPCITVTHLGQVKAGDTDVFLIDETQFYDPENIRIFYEDVVRDGGHILILAGLHATHDLKPFSAITQMLPHAEDVMMLRAICMKCKKDGATFSKRLGDSQAIVEVGGADKYSAMCRACYFTTDQEE